MMSSPSPRQLGTASLGSFFVRRFSRHESILQGNLLRVCPYEYCRGYSSRYLLPIWRKLEYVYFEKAKLSNTYRFPATSDTRLLARCSQGFCLAHFHLSLSLFHPLHHDDLRHSSDQACVLFLPLIVLLVISTAKISGHREPEPLLSRYANAKLSEVSRRIRIIQALPRRNVLKKSLIPLMRTPDLRQPFPCH